MSTWQIFSDADNNFRWEASDQRFNMEPKTPPESSPSLPSMADLLLQGCSNLMENRGGRFQTPPVFQSGVGKPVTVKHSSITKALSILGEEADAFASSGQLCNRSDDGCSLSNSMFRTGSGKKVNISSTGLVRANTLLGLEEGNDPTFSSLKDSKNLLVSDESLGWRKSSHPETREGVNTRTYKDATATISNFNSKTSSLQRDLERETISGLMHTATKCPPIKFNTAGGRSISVSSDALQRARSLLGNLVGETFFNEEDENNPGPPYSKETRLANSNSSKENTQISPTCHQEIAKSMHVSKSFVSPLRSYSSRIQSLITSENADSGTNLIKKFDAEDYDNTSKMPDNTLCQQRPPSGRSSPHVIIRNSLQHDGSLINNPRGSSLGGPLVDISNKLGLHMDSKLTTGEKRRLGRSSISPFKRPRNSRFVTPLNNVLPASSGLPSSAHGEPCGSRRVSAHYPFQGPRKYVKEYFEIPPFHLNTKQLPDNIRRMNPENAEKYKFHNGCGLELGAEAFYHMLAESGASIQHASKEWVENHYKWIVWKLACYERWYPSKSSGKLLTVPNVLEELKYRYEREVNHGHRSAIKRILEGDQPPSSMLILCISSICSKGAESGVATKVELTDGWYSIDGLLDVLLSKKLATGKLFTGQKLRIWGAGLSGWVGPISPLKASNTVSLLLHINGTYRAHWADRLGLCKNVGTPLAFRCIKGMGGPVPRTLVGVTRVYPVLYRERLSNGGFIVRSERMEARMIESYNQRRSVIAEGIASDFQREIKESCIINDNDSEEGAKLLKILERTAEPEVLMAEMTSEQLTSFATYQAKLESIRQSDMQNSIEKALKDAGLSARDITPFMRVRVVELTRKDCPTNCCPRKGLITIWNPTEKQQLELVEGKAYAVTGLIPLALGTEADTLFLQARGSTTRWVPLSSSATQHIELFFTPRKSVSLSHLGEVPLSSEFDLAALVVYVGDVYSDALQKKQWVFVTDGSISESHSEEPSNSLLAISFWSPHTDCDSYTPINHNLVGSVVGFCNLIKRAKDQVNHLWVAETTENSTYFLSSDLVHYFHLKDASASVERWAKISGLTIEKLRRKVLTIVDK
ncbi:protein BREAST CANCER SUSCEPTIBILITY 2 homolog B-like isoform X2 [Diospyros lotus]|uniref:protein BREAST CANCER SUSCEPTIBILITY 2 homolog B-like isoform X2 n=1 Tax=Diospyros lotus TaxID=55363 RepID=UPI0022529881|nr:protein BREAST CANCER SUSCEPTIBILITY 2 homolog B-like isoform X2 [Diospyros lotus]